MELDTLLEETINQQPIKVAQECRVRYNLIKINSNNKIPLLMIIQEELNKIHKAQIIQEQDR